MATPRKTKSSKAAATKGSSKKVKRKPAITRTVKKKQAGGKGSPPKPAASKAKAQAAGTKKKPAATPTRKSSAKPKPPKLRKPAVDPDLIKAIREILVRQRRQLVSMMQTTQAQMADKQTGLADVIDQATEGFEDELALGVLKIEAAQIEEIVAAIARIDQGSYGLCEDCGKPIPRKRLEVLPFALRCLSCKGTRERQARIRSSFDDDD